MNGAAAASSASSSAEAYFGLSFHRFEGRCQLGLQCRIQMAYYTEITGESLHVRAKSTFTEEESIEDEKEGFLGGESEPTVKLSRGSRVTSSGRSCPSLAGRGW